MMNRPISETMRRQQPVTLPRHATVQEAGRLMRDERVGAILVVNEDGSLAGLFTGRDATNRVLAEALDPAATRLDAVMTTHPDTIGPKTYAIDALRLMWDGGYRHVPVVDGKRLVGIVSFGDFRGLERARLDEETGFWEIL